MRNERLFIAASTVAIPVVITMERERLIDLWRIEGGEGDPSDDDLLTTLHNEASLYPATERSQYITVEIVNDHDEWEWDIDSGTMIDSGKTNEEGEDGDA